MKKSSINFKDLYQIYLKKYPEVFKFEQHQQFITYIYLTLTLLTISFFGIFAILPTLSTISTLKKQFADDQLVYENLKTKLQNLQQLDSLYKQNETQIALVNQAIPPSAEIPSLTRKIETIASERSVFISSISTGSIEYYPQTKTPPLYSYTISMTLSGAKDDINRFISDIINFDRIMGIDSVTTGKQNEDRAEVTVVGRVYFYATKE